MEKGCTREREEKKIGHYFKPIIKGNGEIALDEEGHIKKYCIGCGRVITTEE